MIENVLLTCIYGQHKELQYCSTLKFLLSTERGFSLLVDLLMVIFTTN